MEIATHSSILVWEIHGQRSLGAPVHGGPRVWHNWALTVDLQCCYFQVYSKVIQLYIHINLFKYINHKVNIQHQIIALGRSQGGDRGWTQTETVCVVGGRWARLSQGESPFCAPVSLLLEELEVGLELGFRKAPSWLGRLGETKLGKVYLLLQPEHQLVSLCQAPV